MLFNLSIFVLEKQIKYKTFCRVFMNWPNECFNVGCCKQFSLFYLDTPRKSQTGVNYYQHFRKYFIRPYGLAHTEDGFKDSTIAKRLKAFTCEFLVRPNIDISEFSKTILENAKYIRENLEIFDVEAIQRFLVKTDGIVESLQIINKKDTSTSGKRLSCYCNLYYVCKRLFVLKSRGQYVCVYSTFIYILYIGYIKSEYLFIYISYM